MIPIQRYHRRSIRQGMVASHAGKTPLKGAGWPREAPPHIDLCLSGVIDPGGHESACWGHVVGAQRFDVRFALFRGTTPSPGN